MRSFVRGAMALASVAIFAPAVVEAQAKPVVAVMYFENSTYGKDRADFEGIGKGIAELLINDFAQNPNMVVVERERIQALIVEQNLTRQGSIDPQTAIRLGKMIGAQYMVVGGFMATPKGEMVLTGRTVNVETSQIGNPTRIDAKGDDVLGAIAQLSRKMSTDMKIPALRVGQADVPTAVPAGQPAAAAANEHAAHAVAKPAETKPADTKAAAARPTQVAQGRPARKMDMRTAMLYSKALEEEDAGNKSKAMELYRQVDVKFPDYAPVQKKIKSLSNG
ncbi:MAG TPA: CsgG/HfaB family protein [Gemmatimonadaceae bacterium]|nr:CsgG/HfaB family protein [Gemmatimonadaceae bacterium]